MDRPLALCNRSISNCSDDSSQCFSVSTLGSKLSNADSSYYTRKKNTLSSDPSKYSTSSNHNKCKKKKMRRKTDLRDRLAISVHASDSDLKHTRRAARVGMDRQLSISRWMADAVNEHCGGKIQRTVSSHETLKQEQPASPEREESRQQPSSLDLLNPTKPLKFFQRAQSQKSLSKPVRKRSSGPEGLIKDVLRALSGHERKELVSSITSSNTFFPTFSSPNTSNKSGFVNLDNNDIEEDTDDDVEFHSDDDDEDLAEDSSTMPLPDAHLNTPTNQEPLLREQSSRWDASSPSREEKKDVPPLDHLMRGLSSRKMPVPPPPPFSPANSNSELESVVPQDLFQSNSNISEGGSTPCKPLRVTSSHVLRESMNKANMSSLTPPLAPLAAASAAIAIATASMEDTDEEVELNDLVPKERTMNVDNSSHDNKTDAATADSAASIDDQDSWQEYSDEEISVDVSMLSASNTTFTSFTATTHQSNGKSKDAVGSSGLAAYMNRVKREAEESKKPKNYKPTSLGSYMNWAKQRKEEEDVEDKNKKSTLDYSYKSFAEDTFDTFGTDTFGTFDTFESPKAAQKTMVPLPLKACSDHHPVLNLSRRDPSIVPPSMPKRSVSNHEKIEIVPRTPKTPKSRVTQQQALPTTKSPSGDRVKQLLDANKRKCKYSRCHRRCSVPGNFDAGTNMQQQRFPRRVSLDHATYSPESSVARRRASLDMSILSSSSHTTPPTSIHNSSAKQQHPHPSLTPTITKTPRTSPAMSKSRKQLIDEVQAAPDLQSPQKTPINTRNLTSAAESLQNNGSHLVE